MRHAAWSEPKGRGAKERTKLCPSSERNKKPNGWRGAESPKGLERTAEDAAAEWTEIGN